MAGRLMRETGVSCVSMDHIKMGLIRSGLVDASPMDSDESITTWLWPVLREMILTCSENGQSIIIEGCYVDFDDVGSLPAGTQLVGLVMTEEYIRSRFATIAETASVSEHRLDDSWLNVEDLVAGNARFGAAMARAGLEPTIISADWESDTARLVINHVGNEC